MSEQQSSNMTVASGGDDYLSVFMDKTYTLRSLFYLLTPKETYFEHKSPDLTLGAFNMMFSFMLIEQLVFLLKYGRFNGRINDSVTSLGSVMFLFLPGFLMRKVAVVSYEWVYENWRVYDLPYDSVWTYLLSILFIDFAYYWFHRAAHEVSVFWAAHQMHHSSEEYNLTVSFRQSVFQAYCSFYFYLPLALFVRPSIYIVHSHLNLIYQFWLHTEIIRTVGPLEYIMNTPSHHRVHHGRNPYCIDKNYAGVFIIFDRMFGTFAAEKDDEQIAYGLIHPVESFDALYLQTFVYKYVFGRFLNAKSWSERFSVLFKGPGWEEGSPRLGFHEKIPDVESPIKKFDVSISKFLNFYVVIHFMFTLFFFSEFSKQLETQPASGILASGAVFLVIYNLTCFGMIFEKKTNSFLFEALRCALIVLIDMYHQNVFKQLCGESDTVYKIFKWMNIISLNLMVILALDKFFQNRKQSSKKQKSN